MKSKQYLTLGIGMIAGFGVAIAGISHALKGGSNNTRLITAEKAKTIMKNKVPGASISEFSYDTDDRLPKYDATLIKDNYEYEIDINAKTGEIIKFEKEKKLTLNNNTSNENNNSSINNQRFDLQLAILASLPTWPRTSRIISSSPPPSSTAAPSSPDYPAP